MEPKLQFGQKDGKVEKFKQRIKELKRENRRLREEVDALKEKYEACNGQLSATAKYGAVLEKIVEDLIAAHYKDRVTVNFGDFTLCISEKCIKFDDHEEFLAALRVLPRLIE